MPCYLNNENGTLRYTGQLKKSRLQAGEELFMVAFYDEEIWTKLPAKDIRLTCALLAYT